jgi:hypothetical protein
VTDDEERCDYPGCNELAVGHLVRPFKRDRVALCEQHRFMALALLEELALNDQEGEGP